MIFMKRLFFICFLFLFHTSFSQSVTGGHVRLAKIFTDNMVLQREINSAIWGWGIPQTKVIVEFAETTTVGFVNKNGKWLINLPELKAGGPYVLTVINKDTLTLKNIMVGDVWVASGQSNMQWPLDGGVINGKEEIEKSANPSIRFFTVQDDLNSIPQEDIRGGEWLECSPSSSARFSAAAYYFAKQLQKELQVPIGIIHSSWGGTRIQTWMSAEILKTHPDFKDIVENQAVKFKNFENGYDELQMVDKLRDSILEVSDNGIRLKVFKNTYDDGNWNVMNLPAEWSNYGMKNYFGYCWFRKNVEISKSELNKNYLISLGEICCESICYINGEELKSKSENSEVIYEAPAAYLKLGTNTITIRVLGKWGVGGFKSKADNLVMKTADHSIQLPLAGEWKYHQYIEPTTPPWNEYHNNPTFIYNEKIAPIMPFSIKGIIWYQGETDTNKPNQYTTLFPMLINDWRIKWQQGYIPFIYSQLANYGAKSDKPEESKIAELREAQLAALNLTNTAMVVNIDLGTDGDVHFLNKEENGKRFAKAALGMVYKKPIIYSGPIFKSSELVTDSIKIDFSDKGTGLKTKNNASLKGFDVAGKDGIFVKANAKIVNDKVIIWTSSIKEPLYVRYNWADNPDGNLYNKEGLPASPFRFKIVN